MIKNYITIAFRVLARNKVYVIINLVSMGFALACCMISYLNYNYTESFDSHHIGTESLYRVNSVLTKKGESKLVGIAPLQLSESIGKDLAGIMRVVRLHNSGTLVKQSDHVFHEQVCYADKDIFDVFNFPLKYGSYEKFNDHSVVVSDGFVKKHFGNEVSIGREVVLINDAGVEETFIIQAVIDKIPNNSSFQFEMVIPFSNVYSFGQIKQNDLIGKTNVTTFAEIKDSGSIHNLEALLKPYANVYNQAVDDERIDRFYFQPFKEIKYTSDKDFENFVESRDLQANQRGVVVFVPVVMSFLILIITCFNFINISIAFSSSRLKEIGMRKVFGSMRLQLIRQFLTENLILCFLASILALITVALLLPKINALTGFELSLNFNSNAGLWIFIILLPIATAVISGMYPAIFISSFRPLSILKGKTNVGSSGKFTQFMLITQFSLSCMALIVGVILTQNASYQQQVDYGYDIDHVVVTEINNQQEFTVFSEAIRQNPGIVSVAGAVHQIGEWASAYQVTVNNDGPEFQAHIAHVYGEDYFTTMGLRLAQGRHFFPGKGLDADASIIVNQTFAKACNLTDPIGKQVRLDSTFFTIVGVVEDYKQLGLHALVPPCVLRMAKIEDLKYVVTRSSSNDLIAIGKEMEQTWNKIIINQPYRGFLQSDVVSKEKQLNAGFKTVALSLAVLTMLLSAGGFFALVSLNIIKRKKEIGVRKVLGASMSHLIVLMNRNLMRIMLISFAIGSCLGYILVNKLIFQFILVYHTAVGPAAFFTALFFILLSCCFTVGFKVYQAATSNPVEVLRNE